MTEYRSKGRTALSTVLNLDKNINTIEKYIFEKSQDDEEYKQNIYQIIGDILNKKSLKNILENIKCKKMGWEHISFDEMRLRMTEQDDFIINPFQVEEGVLECRCGSKRVYSYSKQVRAADEATSVFAQCLNCKSKWVTGG